jgi:putative ABC transport system permease protein
MRALAQNRSLTVAALATLALGIGANTALSSIVYGVLFRPLPFADPGRLVRLSEVHPAGQVAELGPLLSSSTLDAWRRSPRTVEDLARYSVRALSETSGPEPASLEVCSASPELFSLLGIHATAGRLLLAEDAVPGAAPVVVVSDSFFRARFGGDPSALGRTLDDVPEEVISPRAAGGRPPRLPRSGASRRGDRSEPGDAQRVERPLPGLVRCVGGRRVRVVAGCFRDSSA